jgi:hypothetical protein
MQHLTVLTSKRNSLFDAKNRFFWNMNGEQKEQHLLSRTWTLARRKKLF